MAATALLVANAAFALQVKGTVESVAADGAVRIELPEGSAVAVGDVVRVEAELPGIGPVAIATRWRVTAVAGRRVTAGPDGTPSALPQKGYAAVIDTKAAQPRPEQAAAPATRRPSTPAEWQALFARTEAAARKGDAGAMFQLGQLHENGLGTARAPDAALRWYKAAAERGRLDAVERLCGFYLQENTPYWNPNAALPTCRKAAEAKRGSAMFNYGLMHAHGIGTPENPAEAWRWLTAALDAGVKNAHYGVGLLLLSGKAGRKDPVAAARHLMEALEDASPGVARAVAMLLKSNRPDMSDPFRMEVQRILKQAGAYQGAVDGKFGPATYRAVDALLAARG